MPNSARGPDIEYCDGLTYEDRLASGELQPDTHRVPPFQATGDIPIDDTAVSRMFV